MFALWQCPNRDAGFSPFQLVYGKHIHTTLDLMYAGWADKINDETNVCGWVEDRFKSVAG